MIGAGIHVVRPPRSSSSWPRRSSRCLIGDWPTIVNGQFDFGTPTESTPSATKNEDHVARVSIEPLFDFGWRPRIPLREWCIHRPWPLKN
ncbi:MAG: hypothetical protein DMG03_27720 [Acidobacteria bacterium]|nr:MAG: hypothetical protein DMG03_27720 [Acidobacteriota bacterium]